MLNSNGPPMSLIHRIGSANGIQPKDCAWLNRACYSSYPGE